jgi:hypothetical protein
LLLVLVFASHAAAESALAYLGSGLKLFDSERYAEAAADSEHALELDPALHEARYHLAVRYFNLVPSKNKKTIESTKPAAVALRPRFSMCLLSPNSLEHGKLTGLQSSCDILTQTIAERPPVGRYEVIRAA